jgi:hypothetical protein
MTEGELEALLARPCACGRAHLRVRALATLGRRGVERRAARLPRRVRRVPRDDLVAR